MMLSVDSAQGKVLINKEGYAPRALPGILESIAIGGNLLIEHAQVQTSSGTKRTAHGWSDADVSIVLLLIDDPVRYRTRFHMLKEIVAIFKTYVLVENVNRKNPDDPVAFCRPTIFTLKHPMAEAWGIRQLLFSDLKTSESRTRNKITVTLEFVEHDSIITITQERLELAAVAKSNDSAASKEAVAVPDLAARRLAAMERKLGYL